MEVNELQSLAPVVSLRGFRLLCSPSCSVTTAAVCASVHSGEMNLRCGAAGATLCCTDVHVICCSVSCKRANETNGTVEVLMLTFKVRS